MRPPNQIMMESIIVYSHYEYEDSPLFILRAGTPCNRAEFYNAADILAALDEWYGNTEQETTEWALEFEIWARFLLLDGGLILNPQHLALEEVKDEFLELLNDGPENIRTRYERMFAADMESLKEAWMAAGKPEQFEFDPDACSSREG